MLQKGNLKNQIIWIIICIYLYTSYVWIWKLKFTNSSRNVLCSLTWNEFHHIFRSDDADDWKFPNFSESSILKTSFYTILYISYLLYRVAEGHSVYIITYKKSCHLQNYFTITLSFIHYTVYRNTGIHYTVYIML